MTKGPRLQLVALFAATVALGLPGGWVPGRSAAGTDAPKNSVSLPELRASVDVSDTNQSSDPGFEDEGLEPTVASVEPQRPHPITPERQAMSERRELLGAAVTAIQKKEYESARRWLTEVDALGETAPGSDGIHEVRGYKLILDCLDARDRKSALPDSLLEASKKYVEKQRLPPRRDVRRVCLEGRPFARRA